MWIGTGVIIIITFLILNGIYNRRNFEKRYPLSAQILREAKEKKEADDRNK